MEPGENSLPASPWRSSITVKFIRERPEILRLSTSLRLHGNWGPSSQGTGESCSQFSNRKPNPHYSWTMWSTTLLPQRTDLPTSGPRWTYGRYAKSHCPPRNKSKTPREQIGHHHHHHHHYKIQLKYNVEGLKFILTTQLCTQDATSSLQSWIQFDHDHCISVYSRKKTILLLQDNGMPSDLKFSLLQGNQLNWACLRLPLRAGILALSSFPPGVRLQITSGSKDPVQALPSRAPLASLGCFVHPFVWGCWPGSADVMGGYRQPPPWPVPTCETGPVHSVPSPSWPQASPTQLPQHLHSWPRDPAGLLGSFPRHMWALGNRGKTIISGLHLPKPAPLQGPLLQGGFLPEFQAVGGWGWGGSTSVLSLQFLLHPPGVRGLSDPFISYLWSPPIPPSSCLQPGEAFPPSGSLRIPQGGLYNLRLVFPRSGSSESTHHFSSNKACLFYMKAGLRLPGLWNRLQGPVLEIKSGTMSSLSWAILCPPPEVMESLASMGEAPRATRMRRKGKQIEYRFKTLSPAKAAGHDARSQRAQNTHLGFFKSATYWRHFSKRYHVYRIWTKGKKETTAFVFLNSLYKD